MAEILDNPGLAGWYSGTHRRTDYDRGGSFAGIDFFGGRELQTGAYEEPRVREPFFGVPIRELQKIRKRVGENSRLSMDLYASGNYDAMYLAGLITEPEKMSYEDFQIRIEGAYGEVCMDSQFRVLRRKVPGERHWQPNGRHRKIH